MSKITVSSNNSIGSTKKISKRQIVLRTVEDVKDPDFEQARITMEAWEKIGWDSGKAVANALMEGHGYKIKEIFLAERFSDRLRSVIRETGFSENVLLTYHLENSPQRLISSHQNSGTEIVLQTQELVMSEDETDEKTVDITAIVKGKLPQISSLSARLT